MVLYAKPLVYSVQVAEQKAVLAEEAERARVAQAAEEAKAKALQEAQAAAQRDAEALARAEQFAKVLRSSKRYMARHDDTDGTLVEVTRDTARRQFSLDDEMATELVRA